MPLQASTAIDRHAADFYRERSQRALTRIAMAKKPAAAPETPADDDVESGASELEQAAAAQVTGADSPEAAPTIAGLLRQRNFDIDDDADDDAIISRFEELETIAERAERLELENRQYQAQLLQRTEQQPPPPQRAPEEAAPAPKKPEAPEWNETWESFLTTDDRNNVVIRDEYKGSVDPSLPQKYVTRKRWEREKINQLLTASPPDFETEKKSLRDELRKELLEEFRKEQQQAQVKSYLGEYERKHQAWLRDGANFTPIGQMLSDLIGEHIQSGKTPERAVKLAQMEVQAETGESPWAEPATDAEAADDEPPARDKRIRLRQRQVNGRNRIPQGPVVRRKGAPVTPTQPTSYSELADDYKSMILQGLGEEG